LSPPASFTGQSSFERANIQLVAGDGGVGSGEELSQMFLHPRDTFNVEG
jgi:hypothetical protein